MKQNTVSGRKRESGYTFIVLIITVIILSIAFLKAKEVWETVEQRDLEAELIFRGESIAGAIAFYKKKTNKDPKDLKLLKKEKFLRKLYRDPFVPDGEWNYLIKPYNTQKKQLLVVSKSLFKSFKKRGNWVGVISGSDKRSFRSYKNRNMYNEWAFIAGAKSGDQIPELKRINL